MGPGGCCCLRWSWASLRAARSDQGPATRPCQQSGCGCSQAGVAVKPLLPLLSALPAVVIGILLRRAIIICKNIPDFVSAYPCLTPQSSLSFYLLQTRLQ